MTNRRRKVAACAFVISVAALTLGTGTTGAGANANSLGVRTVANPASLPGGYIEVYGPDILAPPGVQTIGNVSCPSGTRPIGGGAEVGTSDVQVNLGSSYWAGKRSWAVSVNNGSGFETGFSVGVVCIKGLTGPRFTTTAATFASPSGSQVPGTAVCPAGVVVGGGVYTTSSSTSVNITASFPDSTTAWTALMNNASGLDTRFTVYAICRNKQPAGYSLQQSDPVDNPAGTETASGVSCPGTSMPLSGGINATSTGLGANLISSFPNDNSWLNSFNNADAVDNTITSYVICAGT